MKNNAYFEELGRRVNEYWKKEADLKQAKKEIVATKGYGCPEFDALDHEYLESLIDFPLSDGEWKAYDAWEKSENEFIMREYTWEEEQSDFIATIRKAGIKTMVVTHTSAMLMENLHGYVREGCEIDGLADIIDNGEHILGIRLKIIG